MESQSVWSQAVEIADEAPQPHRSTEHESLYQFIPRLSPAFAAPTHLAPIVEALEEAKAAARGECPPVFVCSSVPPQSAKSSTYQHAIAKWLDERPQDFLGYFSYNLTQALDKSRDIRDISRAAGVQLKEDTKAVELWRTTERGGLLAQGMDGSITGKSALKALIIDDPHKNRAEAESRVMRERRWSEFRSSLWTRLHETTSVFVNHTRWHPDDLIGRIKKDPELSKLFRFINIPIITAGCDPRDGDDFEWLWPEQKSKELIKRLRAGSSDYEWFSLYMGEPRPRDTQLFRGVHHYSVLPSTYTIAIGVDLAYTSKKSSDYSVAVVMAKADHRHFVLDVVRRQCSATAFAVELKRLRAKYKRAPMLAYIGGTEVGVIDFLNAEGVGITGKPATADKMVRALPFSDAWNAGNIFIPDDDPAWSEPFVGTLLDFSGVNDPHDDDVDAAAAAYDACQSSAGVHLPDGHRPSPDRGGRRQFSGRGQGAW